MTTTTRSGTCDERRTEKPSLAIVERVAEREGVSSVELNPPLFDVIDPDALDAFFESSNAGTSPTGAHVSFSYCGYDVRVEDDGHVTITEP